MDEIYRLKNILNELGYIKVYLQMYLKNTGKPDNLETITEYINNNIDVWLCNGSKL